MVPSDISWRYHDGCATCSVRASGLNRADRLAAFEQRHDGVDALVDAPVGLECIGEIGAVGSEVAGLGVGR